LRFQLKLICENLRKVKFTFELDASELVDEVLKRKITPVNLRMKDVIRDRRDRYNTRKKVKSEAGRDLDDDEKAKRAEEKAELNSLIHPDLTADDGCNPTGMYEYV